MGTDISRSPILLGDRLCASHASTGRTDPEDRTSAAAGRRVSWGWGLGPHEPHGAPIDGRLVWRGPDKQKAQDPCNDRSILPRTAVADGRRLDPTNLATDP